jgi:hypothetical protein
MQATRELTDLSGTPVPISIDGSNTGGLDSDQDQDGMMVGCIRGVIQRAAALT